MTAPKPEATRAAPIRRGVASSAIAFLFAALPALIPLWLISRFSTNMPCWDEWDPDLAGIYIKAHNHQLTFADFAAQHNEHRIVLPRLVYFALNSLTRWNTIVEMIAGWVIVVWTSLGILWLLLRTMPGPDPHSTSRRRHTVALLWFLCNLVIFSAAQAQNWLWGIGLANFMPALFVIASIIVASDKRLKHWTRTALVILCCTAATFSSGNGLLSWLLAGMVLAWSMREDDLKSRLIALAVLTLSFALNAGLYFTHYLTPDQGQAAPYAGGIGAMIHFFLVFQGNPFAEPFWFAPFVIPMILGVVLLLLLCASLAYFIYVWRWLGNDDLCGRMIVWFAVAGYAILSSVLASRARVGFGLQQAIAPRYVSISLYLTVALIPLLSLILRDVARRLRYSGYAPTVVGAALSVLLMALHAIGLPKAVSFSKYWQSVTERHKGALLLLPVLRNDPQLLSYFIFNRENALRYADALDEIGYLHPPLIRNPNASLIETKTDHFAEGAMITAWKKDDTHVACVGWATLVPRRRAAFTVFVTCDDQFGQPIIVAIARMGAMMEGVIPTFDDPDLSEAGWLAEVPLERFPAGVESTKLTAWVLDTESGMACRLDGAVSARK